MIIRNKGYSLLAAATAWPWYQRQHMPGEDTAAGAGLLPGAMAPVIPKVRVVVQRVGVMVTKLQLQLAEDRLVGIDKYFMAREKILAIFPSFSAFHLKLNEE